MSLRSLNRWFLNSPLLNKSSKHKLVPLLWTLKSSLHKFLTSTSSNNKFSNTSRTNLHHRFKEYQIIKLACPNSRIYRNKGRTLIIILLSNKIYNHQVLKAPIWIFLNQISFQLLRLFKPIIREANLREEMTLKSHSATYQSTSR